MVPVHSTTHLDDVTLPAQGGRMEKTTPHPAERTFIRSINEHLHMPGTNLCTDELIFLIDKRQ